MLSGSEDYRRNSARRSHRCGAFDGQRCYYNATSSCSRRRHIVGLFACLSDAKVHIPSTPVVDSFEMMLHILFFEVSVVSSRSHRDTSGALEVRANLLLSHQRIRRKLFNAPCGEARRKPKPKSEPERLHALSAKNLHDDVSMRA